MDIYQLVRDLIDEAKKQKNLELVDKLIEIKLSLSEIEDENRDLKKKIEELEQSNIIIGFCSAFIMKLMMMSSTRSCWRRCVH